MQHDAYKRSWTKWLYNAGIFLFFNFFKHESYLYIIISYSNMLLATFACKNMKFVLTNLFSNMLSFFSYEIFPFSMQLSLFSFHLHLFFVIFAFVLFVACIVDSSFFLLFFFSFLTFSLYVVCHGICCT